MSRLVAAVHDPWLGLCLAQALGHRLERVITFGDHRHRDAFADIAVTLVPPPADPSTLSLLHDRAAGAEVARVPGTQLIVFKPSRRLEDRATALSATLAHSAASIAQGLENKLALAGIAADAGIAMEPTAGIALPRQGKVSVTGALSWAGVQAAVGAEGAVVVQSPRGFMGKRTWTVQGSQDWSALREQLLGRPAKVARRIEGRPGTVNAVVDSTGATLVTAPIVQVTGVRRLTPFPMGSCGNDFTWRPTPHPGSGPAEIARRLGPVLAARGFRGHFGIDFVVESTPLGPVTWLIEINPRLTASMALYAAWRPILAHAHVDAASGGGLPATGELPPIEGGQLIVHNTTDKPQDPLGAFDGAPVTHQLPAEGAAAVWPQVATWVDPGATRGRLIVRGTVVDADGEIVRRP